jgi:ATP-dependent RNA helicase RhlE
MGGRAVLLDATEILVLDEADQMLDLGFVKPIRQIISHLPRKRQSLFFSATMPREIAALAAELLQDPQRVAVAPVATTAERVSQRVIHIEQKRKRALLAELLSDAAMTRALVFTRTKRGADRVAEHLETAGLTVAAIHGNKSQNQRERALEAFRTGGIRILVATDIAARGIDIDEVSHVINFELPDVPEAYVHRIGRTARAGAAGIAIALCDPEERDLLQAIERLTRQTIPAEDRRNDQALAIEAGARAPRRDERGGRGRGGDRGRSGERQERSASQGRADPRRQSGNRSGGPRGGHDAPRGDRRPSGHTPRPERADREEVWSNHGAPIENRRSPDVRTGERRPENRTHGDAPRRDDRRPQRRDGAAGRDDRREAPRRAEGANRSEHGRSRPQSNRGGQMDRDRNRGARP